MDFINSSVERLVPVVCHYDKDTLITENADLIQTIEITGVEALGSNFRKFNLRNVVRDTLTENINLSKYAFYIHVLNQSRDITRKANFQHQFAHKLDDIWSKENNLHNQMVNFLYVTIVYIGKRDKFLNYNEIKNTLLFPLYKKKALKKMEENVAELSSITKKILTKVSAFDARILSTFEKNGATFSQNLSFIASLIQLSEKEIEIGEYSLALPLAHNFGIQHGFNYLELYKFNPKRRYAIATILTIKGVYDLPELASSLILEHSHNYLITESIFFANKNNAIKNQDRIKRLFTACKGEDLASKMKLSKILDADTDNYNTRQITIALFSADEKGLEENISLMCKKLNKVGISFIREDFNLPKCFWSQVPGNSQYISRLNGSTNDVIGEFAFIANKNSGFYNGSKWGNPVSIFRKKDNFFPYYFNFHNGDNGHTMIVGPSHSGKTILTRFLITQATRFNPKVIYIDIEGKAGRFLNKLDAKSLHIEGKELQIDIFDKRNYLNNTKDLRFSILKLLFAGYSRDRDYVESIYKELSAISDLKGQAAFHKLKEIVSLTEDSVIKKNLDQIEKDVVSYMLEDNLESVINAHKIINIDFSKCVLGPHISLFLNLLLLRIVDYLDGSPAIIALNRCASVLASSLISEQLPVWLKSLSEKNAIILFSTDFSQELRPNQKLSAAFSNFATQIFLSDKFADKNLQKYFMLTNSDLLTIRHNSQNERTFLLKQAGESVSISFNMNDMHEVLKVLEG